MSRGPSNDPGTLELSVSLVWRPGHDHEVLLHLRLSWPHRSFTTSLLSSLSLLILLSSSWCLVGLRPLLRLFLPGSLRHVVRSVVLSVLALATFLDFQPVSVVLPCLGLDGGSTLHGGWACQD